MAKELDAILDRGEAEAAASCVTDDGSAKFLEKIICPIYETLADVSCFVMLSILINLFTFVCWNESELICY